MLAYALRRLVTLAASLVVASLVIFLTLQVVPGDPASYMLGLNASPETVAALRSQLGLDGGPVARYLAWVGGMLTGDFGISYTYRTPVAGMILQRLQVSLPLALLALALSTLIAFPIGIWAAARRGSAADAGVMAGTQLGVAIPNFWFAMLLVLLFAVKLRWVSAGGFPGWQAGLLPGLRALTLPAIALALPQASILARVMRSALIDTLGEDFIRTARAKGLSRGQALRRHALRNALIPVLTIIGLQFSFLLAGAIIIENVFFLPGLGRLVFQAISQRDLIVVQSTVMLLVFAVILVTYLVDLTYAWVDPRLRGALMRALVVGGAIVAVFLAAAILSFFWTPYDVATLDIANKLQPPSAAHWLGTDHLGRDLLSMVMVGARVSIAVALVAVGIGMGLGVPLGLAAAARRGSVLDEVIMRGNDLVFAFPSLLIAIMITAVFGPSAINAIVAIGIFNIPVFARLTRGAALSLWRRDFILAARMAGKGAARISVEHLLPNLTNLLIVQGTIQFSLGILAEAGLSYVGLGAQPPTPSWGRMLSESQTMFALAPHLALVPGLAIVLTVLGLNLMGDGLRDLIDPRLRRVRDMTRLFIVAGEPSGDLLGGALIAGLRQLLGEDIVLEGIGGPAMAAQGLASRFPMEELSVMGLTEVLPRLPNLLRRIRETGDAAAAMAPDALVTIDSPDFSLRVARRARRLRPDLRVIHYVAPTVWAWRPGRAAKMAKVVDHVLALLPFEPPYMQAAGMTCDFVGHPVAAEPQATPAETAAIRAELGLAPDRRLLILLPGSRRGEVTRLAPVFAEVVRRLRAADPGLAVVLPAAAPVVDMLAAHFPDVPILDPRPFPKAEAEARKRALFAAGDLALAASGTVSLELAAAGTPMVIAYTANPLTGWIVMRLALIDTATLVNLVTDTRVVPEFFLGDCTPDRIAPAVTRLLADPVAAEAQRAAGARAMQLLGRGGEPPGLRAARSVLAAIGRPR